MRYLANAAIVLCFFACSANAIVIRHDVSDQEYLDLGEQYSSSAVYIGGCAGTLIDHHWALTAAHCVQGRERALFSVTHIDSKYRIESIIVHSEYSSENDEIYDVALVRLKEPITNGKPAKLYSDKDEIGKPVVFVGRGIHGNGRDGLIRRDGQQRGATNTIVNASEHVIGFKFDAPGKATDLEGISGPGDSGGPAFIQVNSQLYVAGVSSYQVGNGAEEAHYGVEEYYTRVSSVYPWLRSVIDDAKPISLPKHPIIDSIKDNDREKLIRSIDNGGTGQSTGIKRSLLSIDGAWPNRAC